MTNESREFTCFSISSQSPTVLETGFRANTQSSFLLGRGTVTWGRPLMMLISLILLPLGDDDDVRGGLRLAGPPVSVEQNWTWVRVGT